MEIVLAIAAWASTTVNAIDNNMKRDIAKPPEKRILDFEKGYVLLSALAPCPSPQLRVAL